MRPTLRELELRCQKPDHRRIGNWMARRVARPLALRVTWLILPTGISAHAATLIAWLVGLCGVVALAGGGQGGWLMGASLLQAWYVLDHVDGQLARYHRTASLDGVQLDYLMHHSLNLLIPIGAGSGLAVESLDPLWAAVGLGWGLALLMIGLLHDTRYKAFIQRLKRVHGELLVIGGGGGRPHPQPPRPRQLLSLATWLARKSNETHVILSLLLALALTRWIAAPLGFVLCAAYVTGMFVISAVLAIALVCRSLKQESAEAEFARWYEPPAGHELSFRDGWWIVEESQATTRICQGRSPLATVPHDSR